MITVFIDDFGNITDEENSSYKVILTGSYEWCFVGKCWRYKIKEILPKIPLSYILTNEKL